jgi:hypothetical protein
MRLWRWFFCRYRNYHYFKDGKQCAICGVWWHGGRNENTSNSFGKSK